MSEQTTVEMRVCRRHGGDPLPITDFPRNKNVPGGYDRMCKTCWKNRPKKSFVGAGRSSTKPEPAPQPEEVSEEMKQFVEKLEKVELARLSQLPGDRKFFEWSAGTLTEGLLRYKSLYKVDARIVYSFAGSFSRYFIG